MSYKKFIGSLLHFQTPDKEQYSNNGIKVRENKLRPKKTIRFVDRFKISKSVIHLIYTYMYMCIYLFA